MTAQNSSSVLNTHSRGFQMIFDNGYTVSVINNSCVPNCVDVMVWDANDHTVQHPDYSVDALPFLSPEQALVIMQWAASLPACEVAS